MVTLRYIFCASEAYNPAQITATDGDRTLEMVTMPTSKKPKILDAAEELFARHGLGGASLRQIAKKADVDVSLITYHFKTKDKLFAAVIERRTSVFNSEQNFYLEECERRAAPGNPSLEEVVDAFCYVFLKRAIAGDRHWRHFFHLFTRMSNDPGRGAEIMAKYFDPIATRTIDALRVALPGCPEQNIQWGFQFLSGALASCLVNTGSINRLSDGSVDSEDFNYIHKTLVPFACSGLRKLCAD
jgi:AcrR family transcriptional regulator